MKPDNSTWLKKTWPLTLSVLGALGIGRLLPKMYSDFEFSRDGAGVAAWYTDLNQEHEVFRYAYVVGNVTYGGQASWNDADSEIYWHKPGDRIPGGVQYLSTRPWLSIYRRNAEQQFREAKS